MPDEIQQRARALYTPPFRYESGYIFDRNGQMVADQDGAGSSQDSPLRVRGWGRIQYLENPEGLQDAVGEVIAELLTKYWHEDIVNVANRVIDENQRLTAEVSRQWISIKDHLPETKPWSYEVEMSEKVLVTYLLPDGSYAYPWVAHLHSDGKGQYANYAACWSQQVDGRAVTWLSPYVDIKEGTKITHWMPLPLAPVSGRQEQNDA